MKRTSRSNAFSLVETTVALGLGAFCLVAIFGLLPVGMTTARHAIAQSAAIDIVSAVYSDLHATPNTSPTSTQFGIAFGTPATLYFDASGNVTTDASSQVYRLTITFPANSAGSSAATFADLLLTWPAGASPDNASGSVETFVAFDRH